MTMNHEEIQIKDHVSSYITLNREEIQIKDHVCHTWHRTIRRYRSEIMEILHDTQSGRDTDEISCSSYMTLNQEEIRSRIMQFLHGTEPWIDTDQRSCSSYMAMNHEEIQIKDHVSSYMTLNHEEIQIKDHVDLTWHWIVKRYRWKIT